MSLCLVGESTRRFSENADVDRDWSPPYACPVNRRRLSVLLALSLAGPLAAGYLITTPDSLMTNSADYLVITHPDFTSALYPLCALRDSLGLEVKMAEVSQIYSAFPTGARYDRIRAFMEQVYNHWNTRPEFVLLVGDACRDSTQGDFVPVKLFPKFSYDYAGGLTTHGADNWYATLSGHDSIPDLIIGRLPVNKLANAESLVAKILRYEASTDTDQWTHTTMFVSSNDRAPDAAELESLYFKPNGDSCYTVVESQGSSAFLRHKTLAGFNEGVSLVCHSAHGSQPPSWVGSKTLFSYPDVDSLHNADALPVVLDRG
jgi:hypothetical protein